ncbi:hypothetical protein IMG5_151960 [Ichthyophthirius multifiliis]|uniref:Uncharacterized protein n=1 Tax=Ichthyophthirius multifiliis TaxID=5932 RepID=G0QYR0_ICHMU|nr:hypothetical protein IMG5_151960 [Ichthyophthirius multifiliis]EGR29647.1 hypothetical protein IMG5_151960 [Ichthyophthirius multifiliis]|eukprot:XP_004030883.1 hypothetical protein IMG5_151960 [Ichthyophthirius multifiliis]
MSIYIGLIFSKKRIEEEIMPKILNLIKRTVENVQILVEFLQNINNFSLDFSCFASEIILKHLKDYILGLDDVFLSTQCSLGGSLLCKFIKKREILEEIIFGIDRIVENTNDNEKKMRFLKILEGFFERNDKNDFFQIIYGILIKNINMVQNKQILDDFECILQKMEKKEEFIDKKKAGHFNEKQYEIFKEEQEEFFEENWIVQVKKRLNIQNQNKFFQLAVCMSGRFWLRKGKNQFSDIISGQIFNNCVKNLAKLVTLADVYLAGLSCEILQEKKWEQWFFLDGIYVNKREFLETMNELENQLFLDVLENILLVKKELLDEEIFVLSNGFLHGFLHSDVGFGKIRSFLQKTQLKDYQFKNIFCVLSLSCFWSLYLVWEEKKNQLKKEKMLICMDFLIYGWEKMCALEKNDFLGIVLWSFGHGIFSQKQRDKWMGVLVINKGKIQDVLKLKWWGKCEFLIGKKMLLKINNEVWRKNVGYFFSFLAFLEFYEVLDVFGEFFEYLNVEKIESQIDLTSKEFEELYLRKMKAFLEKVGVFKEQNIKKEEEKKHIFEVFWEKEGGFIRILEKNKEQKKGFLDDEELQLRKKEEFLEKLKFYFDLGCVVFQSFSNKIGFVKVFFEKFNGKIIQLLKWKETHFFYENIMGKIWENFWNLQKEGVFQTNRNFIIMFFLDLFYQGFCEQLEFIQEYEKILNFINSNEQDFWVLEFFHQINLRILKGDNQHMNECRRKALIFYFQKEKCQKFLEDVSIVLEQNINILALNEDQFGNLMEKIGQQGVQMKGFLKKVLNLEEKGQKCVLRGISKYKNAFNLEFEEIIKLKILQKKCRKEENMEINMEKLKKWNGFGQFLIENNIDNINILTDLLIENSKNNIEYQKIIYKKYLEGIINFKNNEKKELFFIYYIKNNLNNINLNSEQIKDILNILMERFYFSEVLDECINCGMQIIKKYAQNQGNQIVLVLEKYLKMKDQSEKQAFLVCFFLGLCAPFVKNKVYMENLSIKIIEFFNNVEFTVQKNIAKKTLPDIINLFENTQYLIKDSFQNVLKDNQIVKKLSLSYFLSGLIKGQGILEFQKAQILEKISVLEQNEGFCKKSVVILLLGLQDVLGKLLDPYNIQILEILSGFFGENNEFLQEKIQENIDFLIENSSSFVIMKIVFFLIENFEKETAWKAKNVFIYCFRMVIIKKQRLIQKTIPLIFPLFSKTILEETHPKVKENANQAVFDTIKLNQNPQMKAIEELLPLALQNRQDFIFKTIKRFSEQSFSYFLDRVSISLIKPVLFYGLLGENAGEVCVLVGNFYKIVKENDWYMLENVLKEVRKAGFSNNNLIREKAMKALAKIGKIQGKQYENLKYFKEFLMQNKHLSQFEKMGVAQGIAENLFGMKIEEIREELEGLMEVFQKKNLINKDGIVLVFFYLEQSIFLGGFREYFEWELLEDFVEFIKNFLGDEEEKVRDVSAKIMKGLVLHYGKKCVFECILNGILEENSKRRMVYVNLAVEIVEMWHKQVKEEDYCKEKRKFFYDIVGLIWILRDDIEDQIKNLCDKTWESKEFKINKIILEVLINKYSIILKRQQQIKKNQYKYLYQIKNNDILYNFIKILNQIFLIKQLFIFKLNNIYIYIHNFIYFSLQIKQFYLFFIYLVPQLQKLFFQIH